MSYIPNNASIYLAAFSGCLSGLNQAGLEAAKIADAYAQELDTLWGVAGFTTLETTEIESLSESVWLFRSPLPASAAFTPSAYQAVASRVIALAQQGNAIVVAEGIDPNAGGSGGGPAASNLGVLWTALATMVATAATAVVQLNGYAAVGDGGGGVVFWNPIDTRASDGGTIQAVSGVATGRWNRLFDANSINVRWWGAKGDGSTDDTSAIQTAIDIFSGRSSTKSGEIIFPQGEYKITSTLTYTGNVSVGLRLAGSKTGVIDGTKITWAGAAFGTMMNCYGMCNSEFYSLFWYAGSSNQAAYGVWLHTDQPGGGSGSNLNDFNYCSFYNFKGNLGYQDSACIALGDNGSTQEVNAIFFDYCTLTGYNATFPTNIPFALVLCLQQASGNSEIFHFRGCEFNVAQFGFMCLGANNGISFTDGCQWSSITQCCIWVDTSAMVYVHGAGCEVVNDVPGGPLNKCVFLHTGNVCTAVIDSSEIVIDAGNNSALSLPAAYVTGGMSQWTNLKNGTIIVGNGFNTIRGTLLDANGGLADAHCVTSVQVGAGVTIERSLATGLTAAIGQIPVYDTSGNNLTGIYRSEAGRQRVTLVGNGGFEPSLAIPDYYGIPPSYGPFGPAWMNLGTGTPYFQEQPIYQAETRQTTTCYTFDFNNAQFHAAGTTAIMYLAQLQNRTAILRVVMEVITPFAGLATVTAKIGDATTQDGYLLAADMKAAAGTAYGLVTTDLGSFWGTISYAQGAYFGQWATNGAPLPAEYLKIVFTGASNFGNGTTTNLTNGVVRIYVTTEQVGYP